MESLQVGLVKFAKKSSSHKFPGRSHRLDSESRNLHVLRNHPNHLIFSPSSLQPIFIRLPCRSPNNTHTTSFRLDDIRPHISERRSAEPWVALPSLVHSCWYSSSHFPMRVAMAYWDEWTGRICWDCCHGLSASAFGGSHEEI